MAAKVAYFTQASKETEATAADSVDSCDVDAEVGDNWVSTSTDGAKTDFPLWKLVLSAIPWIGVQALWSTEFAVTTPYMQDLGMSKGLSSQIWIFGPITGFITAPIVGSLSDHCQSRYGRRRPFILAGLLLLWVASLLFASSKYLFGEPHAKWFALVMFVILDVVVNVIQTPIRAIVSDMASQEQQSAGQIISVLFQGFGNLLGFGIMKLWAVPFESIFQLMVMVNVVLTAFVALQMWICHEKPYVAPADAPKRSIFTPIVGAFWAVSGMSRDLAKIAFVQFFSWYSLFCYLPTASTWFSTSVYAGAADAPAGSDLRQRYDLGQDTNSVAGLFNAGFMIVFSMILVGIMYKTNVPLRFVYSACLYAGAVALLMAKFCVGTSATFAVIVVTLIAIPMSGINAFPFALVGAMNKSAQELGKEEDTGVQMGVLNIFITTPQLLATLVVGIFRDQLGSAALPWAFFMAGISFAIAGTGALILNDRLAMKAAR